jgi:hypothetical protein
MTEEFYIATIISRPCAGWMILTTPMISVMPGLTRSADASHRKS